MVINRLLFFILWRLLFGSSIRDGQSHAVYANAVTVLSGASIADACNSVSGTGEVVVTAGPAFAETSRVNVKGTLSITGQSREECFLLKTNNGAFVLFDISGNLTITNLTVLLTNNSEGYNYVRSTGGVSVAFRQCNFRMSGDHTRIYGQSFYFDNTRHFEFDSCTVCDIITSGSIVPLIWFNRLDTLYIVDSSFTRVRNMCTYLESGGGCFYGLQVTNLTFTRSQFVEISNNKGRGGVGQLYGDLAGNGSVILSCTFWGNNAGAAFGDIFIGGYKKTLTVTNTSYTHSHASTNGGALGIGNYLILTLTDCSFTNCSSGIGGGALAVYHSSVNIARCAFVRCSAEEGGAVFTGDPFGFTDGGSTFEDEVSVEYSVFLGNTATEGSDFYINKSLELIVNSGVFTDKASYDDSIFIANGTVVGTMKYGPAYSDTTCSSTFSTPAPDAKGNCGMPCASSGIACVKPDACPTSEIAVNGKCIANTCPASCPTSSFGTCGNIVWPSCAAESCKYCDVSVCVKNSCVWTGGACVSPTGLTCSSSTCYACNITNCPMDDCWWNGSECRSGSAPAEWCNANSCGNCSKSECDSIGCTWAEADTVCITPASDPPNTDAGSVIRTPFSVAVATALVPIALLLIGVLW